ncbi:MAG: helix-turn-helix transcriptional regulator [Lactobacillus sp.]|nr:helix-turn-helix transcriptional regulator [Lactobacillus sp.]
MNRKKLYFEIGQRLLLRRRELNLTQEKVAESLKMSTAYYGKIERGEKGPSLEKLLLISQVLEIDLNYLVVGKSCFDVPAFQSLDKCPKRKQYDFEQLIKYAINLAADD